MDNHWVELSSLLGESMPPLCIATHLGGARLGAVERLFAFFRQAAKGLERSLYHGHNARPACFTGQLTAQTDDVRTLVRAAEAEAPIEPRAPFEGVEAIAGAAWLASDHLEDGGDDGVARLLFRRGTAELPVHVHEHAERVIYIKDGDGIFYFATSTGDRFEGTGVAAVSVSVGTLLAFSRGLHHTFSAGSRGLELVSYQSPALPFDHPRQFRVPAMRWCPPRFTLVH